MSSSSEEGPPSYLSSDGRIQWDRLNYSREVTITAIRSYYKFLISLFAPADCLQEPPAEGWPGLEPLAFLAKTDEVYELLRHLPYLTDQRWGLEIVPEGECCPYYRDTVTEDARDNGREYLGPLTEGHQEEVPAHVLGLLSGGSHSARWLLDTELGIIYWSEGCHLENTPLSVKVPGQSRLQGDWRETPAWPVTEFFEMLKDEIRAMRIVPRCERKLMNGRAAQVYDEDKAVFEAAKEVFRSHGWPHSYDREGCLKALRQRMDENSGNYQGGYVPPY